MVLYFNGVTEEGRPGLPPMNVKDFAVRLQDDHFAEADQLKALQDKLDRNLRNSGKVAELVTLLARATVQILNGEVTSLGDWSELLAKQLVPLLLDPSESTVKRPPSTLEPGHQQALATRLRLLPVETCTTIAKLMVDPNGRGQLAALLLDVPVESGSADVKEYLKFLSQHIFMAIQRELFGSTVAAELAEGKRDLQEWRTVLVRSLYDLPIESLKIVSGKPGFSAEALRGLGQNVAAAGTSLQPLADALAPLLQIPRPLWPDIVQALDNGIAGLCGAESWTAAVPLLKEWLTALSMVVANLGAVPWVNTAKLEQAGWGIVFPAAMEPARLKKIKEALDPLLQWRKKQQTKNPDYFQIYEGGKGYRANEMARSFLGHCCPGLDPSKPADPEFVPYYLLLVGGPEEIPFEFQYQLDVQYAVGRLDFGDDWAAYRNYAQNVVKAETAARAASRSMSFFGVQIPGDEATKLSSKHLVQPLADRFKDLKPDLVLGAEAKKARLLQVLKNQPPGLLFVATHGLECTSSDLDRQRGRQGALVLADWDGAVGSLNENFYLRGEEIRAEKSLDLQGMIAFLFACYGAGTPQYDDYFRQEHKKKGKMLTPQPFTADLPRALLGIPNGALAVVGHVDRAWGNSFFSLSTTPRPGSQGGATRHYVSVFVSAIDQLLRGYPVGAAMEYFNMRYAALSTELVPMIEDERVNENALAELWTSNNDARGYIVLGDPAVKMPGARG